MKLADIISETVYNLKRTNVIDARGIKKDKFYVYMDTVEPTLIGPFDSSLEARKYMTGKEINATVTKKVISGEEAYKMMQ
jgi:hypothetical protein